MDDDDNKPRRPSIPPDPPAYVPETPRFIDAPLREILAARPSRKPTK